MLNNIIPNNFSLLINNKSTRFNLMFKLATEKDADFIISLRTDPKLNKHISYTPPERHHQTQWLIDYKVRENKGKEYYFVVYEDDIPKGTIRIYRIFRKSCTIGSWLFISGSHYLTAIISEIIAYEIAFNVLLKTRVYYDIRKDNNKLIRYHSIKKSICYKKDKENIYYIVTKEMWYKSKREIFMYLDIKVDVFTGCKGLTVAYNDSIS